MSGRTRAAVLAGDVSLAQAAQIVSLPEHEEELLAMARRSGLRAVRDTARKRRLAAIPPEELAARQHAARRFVHWKDELGMIRFRGALPPLDGVPFINRLDTQTDANGAPPNASTQSSHARRTPPTRSYISSRPAPLCAPPAPMSCSSSTIAPTPTGTPIRANRVT